MGLQIGKTTFESALLEAVSKSKAGQHEAAIDSFVSLSRAFPDSADVHFNLGVALRTAGRHQDAAGAFRRALECRPNWPEALFNLGNCYRELGEIQEAVRCFQQAVDERPGYLKALNNLVNCFFEQGSYGKAEAALRQAVTIDENCADALINLGRIYRRRRRLRDALEVTAKAVALRPDLPRYRLKLAESQRQCGDAIAARQTLEALLSSKAVPIEAIVRLVQLLQSEGKHQEALSRSDEFLRDCPPNAELHWARADSLRILGRLDEAIVEVDRAIAIDGRSAVAHNLRGMILFSRGQIHEAIVAYESAIALRPDLCDAHNNLGAALQIVQSFAESKSAFRVALRLKPDHYLARLNNALSLLRDGDYPDGWAEFEWRLLSPDYRLPQHQCPRWNGEPLAGRTILLRAEQGIGDTLQFIRFARMLKAMGARTVADVQAAASYLVGRCKDVDICVKRGDALPMVDVQLPLMSLPAVLGTTVDSVPSPIPYLTADDSLRSKWKQRLPDGDFKVAIAWQGNKKFQADYFRSFPLSHFRRLAELSGVSLVSVQKNDGADQLCDAPFVRHFGEELDRQQPFEDTAAILAACDLVVTSDSAVAHLAGAMGRPTWLALSLAADWRWMTGTETTPWYPTMRLFRQSTLGDWNQVFERMVAELRYVLGGDVKRLVPKLPDRRTVAPQIPVSIGELFDKISILEIKQERICETERREHVVHELQVLRDMVPTDVLSKVELTPLVESLRSVNAQLWDVEDQLRECERLQEFGERFTALARSVYCTNDKRAAIKRSINELLKSPLFEVKSYANY